MLIEFSVRNFKTFKDKATLSLIASNYDKDTSLENIAENNKFNLKLLKSAVIFGANASGKSKFIEALMFMKEMAVNSSKDSQKGEEIPVEPFRLNIESEKEPSEFEIIFLFKNTIYRYGFEVDKKQVVAEWLYHKPKTKEVELFYRDYQDFNAHKRNFSKGTTLIKEGLIRDNALMLSVAAQFNEEVSVAVIEWFNQLNTINGVNEAGYHEFTMAILDFFPAFRPKIIDFLKKADFGIQDLNIKKSSSKIETTHKQYDQNKTHVADIKFSLEEDESLGTKKFFAIAAPILLSLEKGHTLIVDELDAKLHPNLVNKIVALFNSKKNNPKNAQLIFNTHDTNLLASKLFRRDQVWFTDKNKYGEAKLYSLADFKSEKVRKTEAFEENYIRGKYGAVPYLGFFDEINAAE